MLRFSDLAPCWSYLGQFPFHASQETASVESALAASSKLLDVASSDPSIAHSAPTKKLVELKAPLAKLPPIPNDSAAPFSLRIKQLSNHLDRCFPLASDRFKACTIMAQCIEAIAPQFTLIDPDTVQRDIQDPTDTLNDEDKVGVNYATWSRLRETIIVTLIYFAWAPCAPVPATSVSNFTQSEPSNNALPPSSSLSSNTMQLPTPPCFFTDNPFLHAILLAQAEYGRIVNEVAKVAHVLATERPELSASERQSIAVSVIAKGSKNDGAAKEGLHHASNDMASHANVKVASAFALRWEDLRREVSTLERLLIEANLLEVASLAMPVAIPQTEADLQMGKSPHALTNAQAQTKALAAALTAPLPGGPSLPHPLSLNPPPLFPKALRNLGGHDMMQTALGVPLPGSQQSRPDNSSSQSFSSNPSESEPVPFQLAQPDPVCRRIASLPSAHERVAASFSRLRALHRLNLHSVVLRGTTVVNQAVLASSYQDAINIAGSHVVQSRLPHFSPIITQPPATPVGTPGAAIPLLYSLLPRFNPSAETSLEAFIRHPTAFLMGAEEAEISEVEDVRKGEFGYLSTAETLAEHKQDDGNASQLLSILSVDELKEARTLMERAVRFPLDVRQRNRLFCLFAIACAGSSSKEMLATNEPIDPFAGAKRIPQMTEESARTLGIASSGMLGSLADSDPPVAVRALAHLPQPLRNESLNELLQVASVTLGRVQTVAALAGISEAPHQSISVSSQSESLLTSGSTNNPEIISETFVRQFLASAFSRCRQLPDQVDQQRFARALIVFVTALSRKFPFAVNAMSDEVKNFCVEFTKVFGASELYQQLCE